MNFIRKWTGKLSNTPRSKENYKDELGAIYSTFEDFYFPNFTRLTCISSSLVLDDALSFLWQLY